VYIKELLTRDPACLLDDLLIFDVDYGILRAPAYHTHAAGVIVTQKQLRRQLACVLAETALSRYDLNGVRPRMRGSFKQRKQLNC
jgi:hypothetical protein